MTTESTYTEIRDALVRICKSSGRFERGAAHEPIAAPGRGLTFAIFLTSEEAILASGLNSSSTLLVYTIQSRLPITHKPADDIDIKLAGACRDLARRLSGNFRLGIDGVRSIDVRGSNGTRMGWRSGYLNQDNVWYRVFDLTVPIIINDAWPEVE